ATVGAGEDGEQWKSWGEKPTITDSHANAKRKRHLQSIAGQKQSHDDGIRSRGGRARPGARLGAQRDLRAHLELSF
ncbi:MAG: hypothetical protein KBF26_07430, partial [Opitutaceae bacterium]|nr:hypothetical protein [Opitutaceae bacterium]